MSWIVKRKKPTMPVQWIYRWTEDGKRNERVIPDVTTRKEAQKVQRQWDWHRQIEQKVQDTEEPWTLQDAHQELMNQKDLSPKYENEVRRHFNSSLFPFLGETRKLSEITVGEIKRWIAWRKKQPGRENRRVSNSTVRHEYFSLSQCLQTAVECGALSGNPCSSITLKKVLPNDAKRRERILNSEEIQRLLTASEGHLKTFVLLAWATAGRMSEILQLEWDDIDMEKEKVTFRHDPPLRRTKNKRTRSVYVTKEFLDFIVENHSKVENSPWIFSHPDGTRIKNVKTGMRLAAKRAGLIGITAHTIRHSVNSALLSGGFSQAVVRDHVGHCDFRMTSHYAHTQDEEQRAAAKYLAELGNSKETDLKGWTEGWMTEDLEGKIVEICRKEEFVSAINSVRELIKRETGFEPATLSL